LLLFLNDNIILSPFHALTLQPKSMEAAAKLRAA
jgi:hypothetical protein